MAAVITCIVTSLTFCLCSATTSLMGACCGNDKTSNIAPGASSGRKRSVLLLCMAIVIAFAFQYGVAKYIVNISISNYITDAWLSGCNDFDTDDLILRCAGQAGVYRSGFSSFVFFILAAVAVACKRTANREAWPAKYILFLFLVFAMCFVPNEPLFTDIYINIARVGAVFFILFQQIIFVDIAHNWNDGWVDRSEKADAEESGSGQKWLIAIVISAAFLFLVSIVGWVLLFYFFSGCATNTAFISLTIILSLLVTGTQLSGSEGSLLASSLITAYATMLCYNAVTRNPNSDCNPQLGGDDNLSIIIGLGLTIVSLSYVGWSTTADSALGGENNDIDDDGNDEGEDDNPSKEQEKISGVVTNNYQSATTNDDNQSVDEDGGHTSSENVPNTFSNNWKLNLALATISCWFSMVLTDFGSIHADGTMANPQIGEVNMWILVGSQWFALLLYTWTLIAPRIFPDREFS
ncbi:Serinc-domain-containing protein [Fragilariopsis cylindrus CCMP1102]|uniref:Serinc-domain-containing protein n=1 Tax=Fragilariopsis cylindrus CCMP1102 TaxID=635003 RepID=A0A1E7F563_9STRA|nr:Serinc-domain-containing protein [Fragilariopsis cylindrus CCMP1102]|eukprot:OEU13331.1 Serinc-domain-containing protein [Fragilariopsis cylindrus CCMP1102]